MAMLIFNGIYAYFLAFFLIIFTSGQKYEILV